MNSSYKDLYTQVVEEIDKKRTYPSSDLYDSSSTKQITDSLYFSRNLSVNVGAITDAIYAVLAEMIAPTIISGLAVEATDPISNKVKIKAGKGTIGGRIYTLNQDVTIEVPLNTDITTTVFYVNLYINGVKIERTQNKDLLMLAKVVVPNPGTTKIIKDSRDDYNIWDAYIISYKPIHFYGDGKGNLEEDSIDLLRDNIGDILADNLIGNIRLSEDLKISNTAGTLELNSNSLKLFDTDGDKLAEFNRNGTFFYDNEEIEVARFTVDDARIGNILVTKNSIGSGDFISENRGFRIQDDGYAEFENVRVRGSISSSVFEYDKISAVGGKLLVANATVLSEAITSSDTTIQTQDSIFSVGDVLRIKDGTNEEYMTVTDISNAPIYNVTRFINGESGESSPTWESGIAVISTGSGSGGNSGFLSLDAVSQYAPFLDINYRNSSTYDDWSTKVRLGNLEGITDIDFGGQLSGFGLYSDNVYLTGNFTSLGTVVFGDTATSHYMCYDSGVLTVKGSIDTGVLSADCIQGGTLDLSTGITIQSSFAGSGTSSRTIFDTSSIKSYDSLGDLTWCVQDGHMLARSIKLEDPLCNCCYSYLSAGALKFHDEQGDVPYVKRIDSGTATTGTTVSLQGWRSAPEVMIGVKTLRSFDSVFVNQCQDWNVYVDSVVCYDNGGLDYGYSFDVHAILQVTEGQAQESVKDIAFEACTTTGACVCKTCVRTQFQLWTHPAAPSNYCYGTVCFAICYRVSGCGVWCACCFSYVQPNASVGQLKTTNSSCNWILFPCSAQWEIMAYCVSLGWTDSGLASGAVECCICNRTWTDEFEASYSMGGSLLGDCCRSLRTCNMSLSGSNPSNVFCTYLYYCVCEMSVGCGLRAGVTNSGGSRGAHSRYFLCMASGVCIGQETACISGQGCCCLAVNRFECCNLSAYNSCNFTALCFHSYLCYCIPSSAGGSVGVRLCWFSSSTKSVCLVQCYCVATGGSATCTYMRLYSLTDVYGCQCILEPSGCLNWQAISYS